jgi:DNA-binding HxlR family transcriptional regulator
MTLHQPSSTYVEQCDPEMILAIKDTIHVLQGKWKIPIIGALFKDINRFNEMARSIPKITPRMLSRELKELELNGIVTRTETEDLISYQLTPSGHELFAVIQQMIKWGMQHRQTVMKNGVVKTIDVKMELEK